MVGATGLEPVGLCRVKGAVSQGIASRPALRAFKNAVFLLASFSASQGFGPLGLFLLIFEL